MRGGRSESGYSRGEYVSDVAVHATGLVLAIACVPALIVTAALTDAAPGPVAGTAIYGACFIAMILCSGIYNTLYGSRLDWLWQRLDHSAIYLKIAGTFTAFALVAGQGLALLAVLWGAAAAGVALKIWSPDRFRRLSLCLYLGMGWVGAVAGWSIFAALPPSVLVLVATGGTLYTLGVAFYLWETLPYHNTIWHLFVLVASLTLYAAIVVAVVGRDLAPAAGIVAAAV